MWSSLKTKYYEDFQAEQQSNILEDAEAPMPIAQVEKLKKLVGSSMDQETKDIFGTYIKRSLLKEAPDLSKTVTADICDACGVQMMVIANDSMLACSRCAKTRVITSVNAWSASMDVDFSTINSHQKSRLLEWLECAQAKEYGEIPADILKLVMESMVAAKGTGLEPFISVIAQERRQNGPFVDAHSSVARLRAKIPNIEALLKNIDSITVRNFVRNTPAKKFGERSAKIASNLSGFLPERLTADQEEYIRKLFMAASPIYDKWRKTSQPVWPGGYAYFLRSIMILLGWDEFAALFPIQMTGRNQERETMRQSIWEILKWEVVPSSGPQSPILLPDGTILDGSLITTADNRCTFSARGYDEL